MNQKWVGHRARQIPEIPQEPVLSEYLQLESVQMQLADDGHLPLGYNAESAAVYSLDLSRIFCYLIQGRIRSGKTNVLRVLMCMAKQKGGDVALIDLSGGLQRLAQRENIRFLQTEKEIADYWRELLPLIQERSAFRKQALADEMEEQEIYEQMRQKKQYFLFIDDLATFISGVYRPISPENNMQGFLENITERGKQIGIFLFAGFAPERSAEVTGYRLFDNFIKDKTGIHLGGNIAVQRTLNFDYLSYTDQGEIRKPGTGQLPLIEGEVPVKTVVIPLDRKKQGDKEVSV